MKTIIFKGVEVSYRDLGSGPCIVLLHGYLETGAIWEQFAGLLTKTHRVLLPDLPGHGSSGIWGKVHSMDDLAGAIGSILDNEGIEKILLVGHSMGGYVTMAFAQLYPDRLSGYCLFHSTCFADSEEKKTNREREISLVLCNKKRQIINVNIPKGFADSNLERLADQIDQAKKIALGNSDPGIIALLNGMKERPDRTVVLQDPSLPVLLIGGMRDNYIPGEVFEKLMDLAPHAEVLRLHESGHMGFMEEPEKAAEALIRMKGTGPSQT